MTVEPVRVGQRNMEEAQRRLGAEVRAVRQTRGLSVREVARRTEVSASLVSQIETGKTSPSIGTLRQVAKALDVPITAFFVDEPDPPAIVEVGSGHYGALVRANSRRYLYRPDSPVRFELVTPDLTSGIEVLWVELEATTRCHDLMAHAVGEEILLLLHGRLQVQLNQELYLLSEGDSLKYDCSVPHCVENPGPGRSKHVTITTARS